MDCCDLPSCSSTSRAWRSAVTYTSLRLSPWTGNLLACTWGAIDVTNDSGRAFETQPLPKVCSTWVWISRSSTHRSWAAPLGDQSLQCVRRCLSLLFGFTASCSVNHGLVAAQCCRNQARIPRAGERDGVPHGRHLVPLREPGTFVVGGAADQQHPRGRVGCFMGCRAPLKGMSPLNRCLNSLKSFALQLLELVDTGTSEMAAADQDCGCLQDIGSLGGVGTTCVMGGARLGMAPSVSLKPWPGGG